MVVNLKTCFQSIAVSMACPALLLANPAEVELTWFAAGDPATPVTFDPADFGDSVIGEDGSLQYVGARSGTGWQLGWTTTARQDDSGPWLSGTISIINLSGTSQDFALQTALLLNNPLTNPQDLALSASLGLTNLQGTGNALVNTTEADSSLIAGLLDDTTVARLFDAPYSLSTAAPFGSASDTASTTAFASTNVNQQIAMLTSFTLSPGDLLNISYTFSAAIVPAPGALVLLAASMMMGSSRRRSHPRGDVS